MALCALISGQLVGEMASCSSHVSSVVTSWGRTTPPTSPTPCPSHSLYTRTNTSWYPEGTRRVTQAGFGQTPIICWVTSGTFRQTTFLCTFIGRCVCVIAIGYRSDCTDISRFIYAAVLLTVFVVPLPLATHETLPVSNPFPSTLRTVLISCGWVGRG